MYHALLKNTTCVPSFLDPMTISKKAVQVLLAPFTEKKMGPIKYLNQALILYEEKARALDSVGSGHRVHMPCPPSPTFIDLTQRGNTN